MFTKRRAFQHLPIIKLMCSPHIEKKSKPYCSQWGIRSPGYDRLPLRRFEFILFWRFSLLLLYARRRVNCRHCGVVTGQAPWSDGKNQLT